MLKVLPKTGDVMIAKRDDHGSGGIANLTAGAEYTVYANSGDEHRWFRDDADISRIICTDRFDHFTLKGEVTPKKVGHIEIIPGGIYIGEGRTRLTVIVDGAGLYSVQSLRDKSTAERRRTEIQGKIAQCQAEIDRLTELLPEVE